MKKLIAGVAVAVMGFGVAGFDTEVSLSDDSLMAGRSNGNDVGFVDPLILAGRSNGNDVG